MKNKSFFSVYQKYKTISSGLLFYQMACSTVFISTSMFQMAFYAKFNVASIAFVLTPVLSIAQVYPLCHFSTVVHSHLQNSANTIYTSFWYKMTPTLQRYYILAILRSQKVNLFNGYGIINCSSDTFLKVKF